MGLPRAAGEEAIGGAPVAKLAAEGAEGSRGQMGRLAGEEAAGEPVSALEGPLLRKDGVPRLEQAVESLKPAQERRREGGSIPGRGVVGLGGGGGKGRWVGGSGPGLGGYDPCGLAPG